MPSCALRENVVSTSTATKRMCGKRSAVPMKAGQKARESAQRRCRKSERTGPPERRSALSSALLTTVGGWAVVALPSAPFADGR
jgi:hypothetical protein